MSRTRRFIGPGIAACSMLTAQLGAVAGVPVMEDLGPFRVTALRFACAALICLAAVRPAVLGFRRRQWEGAIALGLAMALMTMCYGMALTRIPTGAATALDFLGPVAVAVYANRGWPRYALPGLAAAGVLALTVGLDGWLLDPAGVLFALGAAVGWAAYIVLMRHVGRLFREQDGLCLSLIVAAIATVPGAFALEAGRPWVHELPTIVGLAILVPLLPFGLEMMALRRMEMGAFSILMSLEPAISVLLGFLVLGQRLEAQQMCGVMAVIVASVGAVVAAPRAAVATTASERAMV